MSRILGIERRPNEELASFVIRRNSSVARFKIEGKIEMRARWGLKLATWTEHVYRHRVNLSYLLLQCQNGDSLRNQRAIICKFGRSRSLNGEETDARAGLGVPNRWASRWLDLVEERLG